MITSSGSASSRMRGRSPSVLPRTRTPSIRSRRLRGIVVEEADRQQPSSRLRMISRSTSRPPSPAPTISTRALPLRAAAEGRQRPALVDAARERAHADQEHQREQHEQHDHAVRQHRPPTVLPSRVAVRPGAAPRSPTTVSSTISHDRAHDRLVVALADVAPAALVDAREHQHRAGCRASTHQIVRSQQVRVVALAAPSSKRSWKAR